MLQAERVRLATQQEIALCLINECEVGSQPYQCTVLTQQISTIRMERADLRECSRIRCGVVKQDLQAFLHLLGCLAGKCQSQNLLGRYMQGSDHIAGATDKRAGLAAAGSRHDQRGRLCLDGCLLKLIIALLGDRRGLFGLAMRLTMGGSNVGRSFEKSRQPVEERRVRYREGSRQITG